MKRNPDAGFYERKLVCVIAALADVHRKRGERASARIGYRAALEMASRLQAAARLSLEDQKEPDRFRKELAGCP
jgi:hypothetical protein